jgi:hypothetical protein
MKTILKSTSGIALIVCVFAVTAYMPAPILFTCLSVFVCGWAVLYALFGKVSDS